MAIANNQFDPVKFAAIYDAVVLAKLTLLDRAGLVELANTAGAQMRDGTNPFANVDNIISDAVANIDGNHQWMDYSPPLAKMHGPFTNMPVYSTAAGFVPWKADVRDALFRRLFKGPISKEIDGMGAAFVSGIIASDYPYHTCAANPFPGSEKDQLCIVIPLLPILGLLLN
ncbi:MAG TPA: hypothetical protein PK011_04035 [Marinagarivorans sp.]|nr:hypothetical protein [Marinagarivorans sp.]